MKLNSIVIEDEPIARQGIINYINLNPNLNLIGDGSSIEEAFNLISNKNVELVFLDINLNQSNGIELLKVKNQYNFEVILITAYSDYAIQSYDLEALDYLLKPVSIERFNTSVNKAIKFYKHDKSSKEFYFKSNGALIRVNKDDIVFVTGMQNYIQISTVNSKKYTVHNTLTGFIKNILDANFIYIHKSYIINKKYIESVGNKSIRLLNIGELPLSRNYKDNLLESINVF